MKSVYKDSTEDVTLAELDNLEEKCGAKYLIAIKSGRNNWDELSSFFKYLPEIRKIIYTTKKWTQGLKGWAQISAQLSIFFKGRLDEVLF